MGKVPELINEEIGINVEGGKKIKINKRVSTFIREMSVGPYYWLFEFTSAQCSVWVS